MDINHCLQVYRSQIASVYPEGVASPREEQDVDLCQALTQELGDPFVRSFFQPGHFTGSALILNPKHDQVLLMLHRKLNKWMQMGGHADGHQQMHEVALREAQEESGIHNFKFLTLTIDDRDYSHMPFDIDIHAIPAIGREPAHQHFDLRFLLQAPDMEYRANQESLDLKWFPIEEALGCIREESVLRMLKKVKFLQSENWL